MTERLYLSDPYLKTFDASVLEVRQHEGKPAAILDRSAFYPEGGGQPGDRGTLGAARVLDTQERGGAVLHVLDRELPPGPVQAALDWPRRFDHMQQHHGQHLLSAIFEQLEHAPTLSFHLGERSCTIDLDKPAAQLDLRKAERACNEAIWRDLPVVARDFTGEERAKLPLRKEPVKGDRVVLVEGVDASPCGGTHPRRTGEVGCVAILRAQRWGEGKARVEFVCGGRVVQLFAEANELIAGTAEALKSAPADIATAAARVAAESGTRRKQLEGALADLAKHEAAQLSRAQGPRVVARVERGSAFARSVALAISAEGGTALIASVDEGRAHLCFSRPKNPAGPNLGALLKEALAVLGGKGGGSAELAQGSGNPEKLDEALALAASRL